jgi:hypothetical protein
MKGFVQDIEELATKNANFRRELYTAKNCQLVVMSQILLKRLVWKFTSSTSCPA